MSSVVERMPQVKRIEFSLRAECLKCGKTVYLETAAEEPQNGHMKEVSHSTEIEAGQTPDKLHCSCKNQKGTK